jgi:hypothetical protein
MSAVAEAILDQLGGRSFLAMTGARDLVGGERRLTFRLPRGFAQNRIDRVEISLDASDTYTVRFTHWNARALCGRIIRAEAGIYDDMLAPLFREATGLETRMPSVFRR